MSGTATPDQIRKICQSADKYLYDEKAGGYRLNTDFGEEKMDLGRMFGFAYGGEGKRSSIFPYGCHVRQCTVPERICAGGNKALQALLNAAMNFDNSRMYPGLPEYYDLSEEACMHTDGCGKLVSPYDGYGSIRRKGGHGRSGNCAGIHAGTV